MTVRLYVRLTCQGPRASALYSHMQLRPARLLATTNNVSSSLGNAVPGPGGRPRAGVVSGVCLYGFRLPYDDYYDCLEHKKTEPFSPS